MKHRLQQIKSYLTSSSTRIFEGTTMEYKGNKFLMAFTILAGLLFLIINLYSYGFYNYVINQQPIVGFLDKGSDLQGKPKRKCRLPQLDPWDPELVPYLYPDWDMWKNCNVTRVMHTELKNGMLRMLDNVTSECEYRCLLTNREKKFNATNWTKMKKDVTYYESCDLIETHCTDDGKTVFRYVHVQVIRSRQKQFQQEDNLHPGVFMLVFDSTSSSSGIRTIVKANQVLRQLYDATTFYYHNKVGINSRPNAIAMFSGSRITELDERHFPGKNAASEIPNSCKGGVNKNETVTYDFVNQSYASIIAEDWVGAFSYPNCIGYGDPPTDHYGAPLMLRSTDDISDEDEKDFDTHFYTGECHERYHKIMDYVGKFLDEYNGISKFIMVWISELAHNSASGLYRADKYFADFFRKYVQTLQNSFIFIMGDHGLRFTRIRRTRPGAVEDNNPLLTIAVPKFLRSNEQLMMNLKSNSRRHTSQYDFYTTLYDIARYARKDGFQKWDEHDFRKEFGEIRGGIRARSLLRPIRSDRTCEEMEIPEEYCICVRTWHTLDTSNENVTQAAQLLISDINEYLKKKSLDGICETLVVTNITSAEDLEEEPVLKIVVNASPSNGLYEAQLEKNDGVLKVVTKVNRVDEYGNQGHCAMDEDVRPLCYCKQQLTTVTPQATT